MKMQEMIRRASARIRKLEEQRTALRNALTEVREEIFTQEGNSPTVVQIDKALEETKQST